MIEVRINGELTSVESTATIAELVERVTPTSRGVAVAHNGEVIPRGRWAEESVAGGDEIEILTAAQGG